MRIEHRVMHGSQSRTWGFTMTYSGLPAGTIASAESGKGRL